MTDRSKSIKNRIAFESLLSEGDFRTAANIEALLKLVTDQRSFNTLFEFVFHADRKIVMHAIDAIEKITIDRQNYLTGHEYDYLKLLAIAKEKELKWHLAQLAERMALNDAKIKTVVHHLHQWAADPLESRIVRTFALDALWKFSKNNQHIRKQVAALIVKMEKEKIPSLLARIKKLKKFG